MASTFDIQVVRRPRISAAFLGALLLCAAPPATLVAQLRPLDPLSFDLFETTLGELSMGAELYEGQRASLAGTEGRLLELGTLEGIWRLGRVAIQASGTLVRTFADGEVFADPVGNTRAPDGARRTDAGDYRVSTIVRLTPQESRAAALLRFGVRLPTTDDETGLERDQTDFFATLAGQLRMEALTVGAEGGVGVYGTRHPRHEQVDPFVYSLGAEYAAGPVRPSLFLVGQHDPRPSPPRRGNEDLAELRAQVRAGDRRWVRVGLVRGLVDFSPRFGLAIQAGLRH